MHTAIRPISASWMSLQQSSLVSASASCRCSRGAAMSLGSESVLQELDPTHEVAVRQEVVGHVAPGGGAEACCVRGVAEQALHREAEPVEIVGVGEKHTVAPIDDLIADATDRARHDGPGLPHGLGHG